MSNRDIDQNKLNQLIDDLFDQSIPEPDSRKKQSTIDMAMSEFDAHMQSKIQIQKENNKDHQGIKQSARPIGNRVEAASSLSRLTQPIRRFFMNITNNQMLDNAFATFAVAFVAVSVVLLLPSTRTPDIKDYEITQSSKSRITVADLTDQVDSSTSADTEKKPAEQPLATLTSTANISSGKKRQEELQSLIQSDKNKTLPKKETALQPQQEFIVTARKASEMEVLGELRSAPSDSNNARLATIPTKQKRTRIAQEQYRAQAPAMAGAMADDMEASILSRPEPQPSLPADQRLDSGEEYAKYSPNKIKQVHDEPISTFSIDVDTASYSLMRNQLNNGYLPKPQAIRAEELINYFNYNYALPSSTDQPFKPSVSVVNSPWNEGKKLVHIGIKGYDIRSTEQPDSNLVFLLDVSGSMNSANKLPLVKQSVGLLLESLKPTDTVSIVVYAGAAGTVLEPTPAKEKQKILSAMQKLRAGGSTAGSAGIKLAYELAEQNFIKKGVNRIILATDGDFNVGQSSNEDLKTLVERKRNNGVFLSILGFGRNNYQDDMMQTLAQNGNGVAAYIDTLSEAKKVLVDEATSTLFPIAKDVKIQVEFNPNTVNDYRLIGYETRQLDKQDFNNDKVDAGDIGAGHTVTAIYEITPVTSEKQSIDAARYAGNKAQSASIKSDIDNSEYGFLKIRYKLPNESKSKLIQQAINIEQTESNEANFSIAVAGFAQLLSNGQNTGDLNYDDVIGLATKHKGNDPYGYRSEFIQLVRMAKIAQP